eukprot:scaffold62084_cov103-Phaeocystis_antarctica.AAC.2
MKVAQRMKRRSRKRHVRLSAVSHMATMARCAALPPHGPRPPVTATRACRDHHNHHGAPKAGAHSAEAIRLCAEGKQKWIRPHFLSVRWPCRAADLTSTPPTAITGRSAPR